MNTEDVICHTRHWVKTVIVGLNFCPFAKRELERERIRFSVSEQTEVEYILEDVVSECVYLEKNEDIETTLLIFPEAVADFESYLDMLDLAEQLLIDMGYEGIYQLASFHPQYCFAQATSDDAANYTNRSPYPMLHLLRESSLEQALLNYPEPENIPEKNINRAREAGLENMQSRLEQCYAAVDSHLCENKKES